MLIKINSLQGTLVDRTWLLVLVFCRLPPNVPGLLKKFLFHIGVEPINNIVIVSDRQQRDSAMIQVSIFPQTSLPPRPPHNISGVPYTIQ